MAFGAILGQKISEGIPAEIIVTPTNTFTSIIATSPSGTVYPGVYNSSSNTWTIEVVEYGEYTVTGQIGGDSVITTVTVTVCTQYPVTLGTDSTLYNNSWAVISNVSQAGNGSSFWSVGDAKGVIVNGTVGTQAVNGTYYVYIIGFNHNSSREGNGITFGTFKTALSGGKDICLVDSNYKDTSTGGQKWFNMNHSSNTNSGGWKGCNLRYDVLGSTNTNNGDATATTATSPVTGTLMAALPSDLRAVMKPMTIYTDNTGGSGDTASYVTASVDYLPLLAEFEIFGTRTHANSAEQNYQQQYAYYSAGNSKVKYRHSATGSTAYWWERSPYYNNSISFCVVNTDGRTRNNLAGYSNGLAPIFRV